MLTAVSTERACNEPHQTPFHVVRCPDGGDDSRWVHPRPQRPKTETFRQRRILFSTRPYREAAIEFQNAIQIDPKYAEAHYELSQTYLKQGDWLHAYQELVKTVEINPNNLRAHSTSLICCWRRARFPTREITPRSYYKTNRKTRKHKQSFPVRTPRRGSREGRNGSASGGPDGSKPFGNFPNLAVIQEKSKDVKGAEQSYLKAVSLNPKSLPALLSLGTSTSAKALARCRKAV